MTPTHHAKPWLVPPFYLGTLLRSALDVWRVDRDGMEGVADRQRTRLALMVALARKHSAYYADLFAHVPEDVTDVSLLPVTKKSDLMAAFDAWVTDGAVTKAKVDAFVADHTRIGDLFLGRYVVWTTSGSTGRPGTFLHDPAAMSAYGALAVRSSGGLWPFLRHAITSLPRGTRLAAVVATGGHFATAAGVAMAQKYLGKLGQRYQAFSVMTPMPQLVDALNAYQPTTIMGYPSALALLAEEQRAGRLRIRPQSITSGSEGLQPGVRRAIAEGFSCPVRDNYASTEFPATAMECSHERLHVNADWVIVEPVDAHYQPVPRGVPSHTTLITNLANRIAPVIRYDQGDSITIADEPCPCGSPLPTMRVDGRRDDVLFFDTPSGARIAILPLALETVIEEAPGVLEFQAIQTGPRALSVRLVGKNGSDDDQVWHAVVERVQRFLAERALAQIDVLRDPTPPGRDPRSGKLRRVWVDKALREPHPVSSPS